MIVIGNMSFPIAVMVGVIEAEPEERRGRLRGDASELDAEPCQEVERADA